MSNQLNEQAHNTLSELGLNDYETRAYLTIIEGGVVVAREVSDRASIPYAKVYQTLNSLISKQLILGDEGRPKKFRAKNPSEAIPKRLEWIKEQWLENHKNRIEKLNQILPDLEALFEQSDVNIEEETGVWNIVGLSNILSRTSKLFDLTSDRVIVIDGADKSIINNIEKEIKDHSFNTLLITSKKLENSKFDKVIEISPVGPATRIFFDEFAMMTIIETKKGRYSSGEYSAVLTQIPEIVKSNLDTFEVIVGEKL